MRKLPSRLLSLSVSLGLLVFLGACDTSGGSDDDDGTRTIYTAGEYDSSGQDQPCYWVGKTMTALTLPAGYDGGSVSAIQVVGGTIYTAGYLHFENTTDEGIVPCYWTGTTPTVLPVPAGTEEASAESLFISGSVVYMAGFYEVAASGDYVPCYWKGSEKTDLPLTTGSGSALGVYVSEGKVYVSGRDGDVPCYWIDGVRTSLSSPSTEGCYAHSIIPTDGVLYVGGSYEYDPVLDGEIPCYWKDGARTDLTVPTHGMDDGGFKSVVANGTIYTSGTYGVRPVPCYWTGTKRTDISVPSTEFGAFSVNIFVSGDTVYSAGGYYPTATTSNACYWTGKERTKLSVPEGSTDSGASCIYVQ